MVEESSESVPLPPNRLKQPNVVELGEREIIHRIHSQEYRGNDFNPCKGGITRFAPIHDTNQNCIPTLYAAGTVGAAIYETIFHDVPLGSDYKSVPLVIVQKYQHSVLRLRRLLRVASLRAPDLIKWGVSQSVLIGCTPAHYERTVEWARSIHDQFTDLDGMIWTSNRYDPDSALLIFGDRVRSTDFTIDSNPEGSADQFLRDVRTAAQRGDILITM